MRPGPLPLLLLSACITVPDPDQGWVLVGERDGIRISALGREGSDLPRVRGEGQVAAGLYEVLAVLYDVARSAEWVPRIEEARYLEVDGAAGVSWVYQRGRAPLPANLVVWDRDVVVHSRLVEQVPGRAYRVVFQAAQPERVPVPSQVVRVPRMEGQAWISALDDERTLVRFEIELDAGGALPEALQAYAVRELPIDSLRALRERVEATRGEYEVLIAQWRAGGVDLDAFNRP